jgi:hypothetical protein
MSTQLPLDIQDRHRLVDIVARYESPEAAARALHMSRDGIARALVGLRLQAASREVIRRAIEAASEVAAAV